MRISIVTPSYQQARFLRQTLESVQSQDFDNVEHIVIDGGSMDESPAIIREFERSLAYWVSEADRGQSHAINKGFESATGDVYGWLNSDDYYLPGALAAVAEYFERTPDCGVLIGQVRTLNDTTGKLELMSRGLQGDIEESLLDWKRNWFPQQSTFWRASLWQQVGGLDETLNYVMDYDLWIRFARAAEIHTLDKVLAVYRFHKDAKCEASPIAVYSELMEVQFRHFASTPEKLKSSAKNLISAVTEGYEKRLEAIESSVAWRLGSVFTWPLRLIR